MSIDSVVPFTQLLQSLPYASDIVLSSPNPSKHCLCHVYHAPSQPSNPCKNSACIFMYALKYSGVWFSSFDTSLCVESFQMFSVVGFAGITLVLPSSSPSISHSDFFRVDFASFSCMK